MKKGLQVELQNQKFRLRWPRRTIETGRLRDVQCRPSSLLPDFLDRPTARQGKYEEKEKEKRK
jgi:hypothetical protein